MAIEQWYCPKYPECHVTAPTGEEGLALMERHFTDVHYREMAKRTKRDIIQDIRSLLDELWKEGT